MPVTGQLLRELSQAALLFPVGHMITEPLQNVINIEFITVGSLNNFVQGRRDFILLVLDIADVFRQNLNLSGHQPV
ncbi:hypothetical protein D3C80_2065250 [compost metagenome]